MEGINPYSNVPLYQQIYDILHQKITQQEWKPGTLVPSEAALMKMYDVSRITVRKAFEMLVQEGLVYRKSGKGTLVAHAKLEHNLSHILSFTEDMKRRGFNTSTRVLVSKLVQPTEALAQKLQIPIDEELVHLKRLRLADDEPMCIEDSYWVHKYCHGILDYDFATKSLRELIAHQFGIKLMRANQMIRALNAPPDMAAVLSIKPNAALLFLERISYSQDNIAVEFLKTYYRADRYTLYNELQGG